MDKKEFAKNFNDVCTFLHIDYHNLDIYYEAFSHPSFANENHHSKHYERLEFLGDAILDFLVGEYIYKNRPDMQEGKMTKLRAKYVCEQANADYTKEMKLNTCLMVGKGAKKQGEDQKLSVLGNVFESFLGAIYLDHNMEYARKILERFVFPKIFQEKEIFFEDYKSELQELIQAENRKGVTYITVSESGPAHDKVFEVIVQYEETKLGRGKGKTKKEAEQNAAKDALTKLAK